MANPIAFVMILLYFAATTLVGVLMVRRSRGSEAWAVASGGMGIVMAAVGIAGTRVGGAATYGVAGDVITGGVWNMWWYGISTLLAMVLFGVYFALPYRRLGIQTVGEIFFLRFGTRRSQWMTSLCVQTEYAVINIIEPYVIGRILATVTGMPFGAAVAIGGLSLVSYTAMGGLWGSSATNLIHCIAMSGGLLAVALVGMTHLGGWASVAERADAALASTAIDPATWWSVTGGSWLLVIGMIFSAVIHTPAVSVYVNFARAANSERSVIPSFLLAGLIAMPIPILAGWIGIESLATYGAGAQLASYQTVTRLATEINPWLGGIAMAAVLAAVVSSGGPILLSSAMMFIRDWWPGAAGWDGARKLRAYRTTTIVYGLLAAAIAWLGPINSVLEMLLFAFAMVVPPAVAVGYLLYWTRTTEAGVFWGMVSGYTLGLLWYLVMPADGLDPSYVTTIVPLIVIPAVSLMTPEHAEGREAFYARMSTAAAS